MAADRYLDGNAPPGGDGLSWATAWNTWAPMQSYLNGGTGRSGEGRNLTVATAASLTQANTSLTGDGTLIFSNAGGVGISLGTGPFVFDTIIVANCGGAGINGNGSTTLSMTNCDIYGNTGNGVGGLGLILSCVDCNIYNNTGQGLTDYNKAGTRTITSSNFFNNGTYGLNTNPTNSASSLAITSSNFYRNSSAGCVIQTNNMTGTIQLASCSAYQNGNYGFWNIIGNTSSTPTFTGCIARFNTSVGFTFSSPTGSPSILIDQCSAIGELVGIQLVTGYTGTMTVSNCDFLFCQTGCNFNQNSAYTVSLIDSILYFCLLGVIKHATPTVNITYCCFNSNVTDVSGVTKGTGCITGAPELVNPSADPPDLRLKSTSACIGVSSTSNDIGAVQYVQIPPGVPTITAAPNADEESIDVTLAAMPAGASQVKLYKRTSTGFDSLVHTFTGTGTYQDDNGGSGYSIYRVVRYIAIADDGLDTFYSLPSLDVLEQVGTSLKFTRAAFIERIKDMLATEAAISTSRLYGYKIVTEKRDPNPFRKSIYIVDGSPEFPEIQYATQRMENQLPIDILIMRKTAVSAPGKRANDLVVERVLQLLAINYRWNENCYDTLIEEVEPYDEREGATPHFPVARITLRGLSQYMRFQP